jgi:hypothetical protein
VRQDARGLRNQKQGSKLQKKRDYEIQTSPRNATCIPRSSVFASPFAGASLFFSRSAVPSGLSFRAPRLLSLHCHQFSVALPCWLSSHQQPSVLHVFITNNTLPLASHDQSSRGVVSLASRQPRQAIAVDTLDHPIDLARASFQIRARTCCSNNHFPTLTEPSCPHAYHLKLGHYIIET